MKLFSVRCERGEGIRLFFENLGGPSRREIFDVGAIFWLVAGKRWWPSDV